MKIAKNLAVVVLLLSSLIFTRCTTEASDSLPTSSEMLMRGTWAVDHFFSGTDQTAAYDAYEFSFASTGIMSCAHSASHYEGDWQVMKKVESEVLSIELATSQTELLELNDRWTISGSDAQTITLKSGAEILKLRRR
jgi:hypothetical protein